MKSDPRTFNRRYLKKRPSGLLYHYTTAAGLLGILQNKCLWATSSLHLNDGSELLYAESLLQAEIQARLLNFPVSTDEDNATKEQSAQMWNDLLELTEPKQAFVISFSENGNQLSQWRAYCPDGDGYSLGFCQDDLNHLLRRDGFYTALVKCLYDRSEQKELIRTVVSLVEALWRKKKHVGRSRVDFFLTAAKLIGLTLATIKHPSFEQEEEWRVIVSGNMGNLSFRVGRFGVVPFYTVKLCEPQSKPSLAELYIGPTRGYNAARAAVKQTCDVYLLNAAARYWGNGLPNEVTAVCVTDCGIPYQH